MREIPVDKELAAKFLAIVEKNHLTLETANPTANFATAVTNALMDAYELGFIDGDASAKSMILSAIKLPLGMEVEEAIQASKELLDLDTPITGAEEREVQDKIQALEAAERGHCPDEGCPGIIEDSFCSHCGDGYIDVLE